MKFFEHDLVLDTTLDAVLETDVVYITVPSPSLEDGSCDVSIVENVIQELKINDYAGVIAIKVLLNLELLKNSSKIILKKYVLFRSFLKKEPQKKIL